MREYKMFVDKTQTQEFVKSSEIGHSQRMMNAVIEKKNKNKKYFPLKGIVWHNSN